ncbi:MAG TPA: hypothetical protein VG370_32925 [Chloroflexota bacterium]|nr:hypothetical protein [Chloroflexota bacterium]
MAALAEHARAPLLAPLSAGPPHPPRPPSADGWSSRRTSDRIGHARETEQIPRDRGR